MYGGPDILVYGTSSHTEEPIRRSSVSKTDPLTTEQLRPGFSNANYMDGN